MKPDESPGRSLKKALLVLLVLCGGELLLRIAARATHKERGVRYDAVLGGVGEGLGGN